MYKLFTSPIGQKFILRITDNAFIPLDPANMDYQQYLEWLEAGNTPEPAQEPE